MAFFQQLIADLEHTPRQRDVQPLGGNSRRNAESAAITQRAIDVPKEVLKFAPKKMRRQQTAEDRIDQLETEIKQWQDRAGRAETRLRFIEKSIQQIAAEHIPGFRKSVYPPAVKCPDNSSQHVSLLPVSSQIGTMVQICHHHGDLPIIAATRPARAA
jgi:hypothetical protein